MACNSLLLERLHRPSPALHDAAAVPPLLAAMPLAATFALAWCSIGATTKGMGRRARRKLSRGMLGLKR